MTRPPPSSTLFPYTTLFRSYFLKSNSITDLIYTVSISVKYCFETYILRNKYSVCGFCLPVNGDRKSTRLNSSHVAISYAVFCLKKKSETKQHTNNKLKNGLP